VEPERTRISYIAALTVATFAAFSKESRMKFANAANLDRKSGVAQWRDLQCAPALAQRFPFRWFSHRIVILRGCGFIGFSREVIDL